MIQSVIIVINVVDYPLHPGYNNVMGGDYLSRLDTRTDRQTTVIPTQCINRLSTYI